MDVIAGGLFVTDAELIKRLGVDKKTGEIAIAGFEREPHFPFKDPLLGGRRYWPAVRAWLDARYGIAEPLSVFDGEIDLSDPPSSRRRYRSPIVDGNERWPKGDGKVEVIAPDGRKWFEDAKPTDPKSWQKKRELKPRTPPT